MNDHNRQQGEKTMTDHKTGTRKDIQITAEYEFHRGDET